MASDEVRQSGRSWKAEAGLPCAVVPQSHISDCPKLSVICDWQGWVYTSASGLKFQTGSACTLKPHNWLGVVNTSSDEPSWLPSSVEDSFTYTSQKNRIKSKFASGQLLKPADLPPFTHTEDFVTWWGPSLSLLWPWPMLPAPKDLSGTTWRGHRIYSWAHHCQNDSYSSTLLANLQRRQTLHQKHMVGRASSCLCRAAWVWVSSTVLSFTISCTRNI